MSNPHVLIVDDEADIRALIQDILADESYGVTVAADASEARSARAERKFDLILLDIWMPDTDGITLLREWSESGEMSCPVVIMSGHGTVDAAVEATRLGAFDFVEKPLSIAKLLRTVEAALESAGKQSTAARNLLPSLLAPVGRSALMQGLRERVQQYARHDGYRFPEPAARSFAQLSRYAAWRRRPDEAPGEPFESDDLAVARLLAKTRKGYLPPEDAIRILEHYGVPVAAWRLAAADAGAATAAAEELGYPVVIKAVAPELIHKSDVGAVRVDVRNAAELATAIGEIEVAVNAAGHQVKGWLLQELLRGGHEVIFGISTDARFGPLLMFGLGGKYVEVFRDVRFGVPPLTRGEAAEMVRGIRGLPLLEGVRGETGADLALLEETLLRLSQLCQRHPSIQELDLNPFLAAPGSDSAKALDARIRVGA